MGPNQCDLCPYKKRKVRHKKTPGTHAQKEETTWRHHCFPRAVIRGDSQSGSSLGGWLTGDACPWSLRGGSLGTGTPGHPGGALLKNLNSGFLLPTRFVLLLCRVLSSNNDNNKNKLSMYIKERWTHMTESFSHKSHSWNSIGFSLGISKLSLREGTWPVGDDRARIWLQNPRVF